MYFDVLTCGTIQAHCPTIRMIGEEHYPDRLFAFKLVCYVEKRARCNRTQKYLQKFIIRNKIAGVHVDVEVRKYAER